MKFKAGEFIRYTYRHHTGITPGEIPNDYKEILVLHPLWQGKVHGIDLKRLTAAERAVLTLILDPNSKGKTHAIPLVNDILNRMDPIEDIKNPVSFYNKFVRVFIRDKDVYRTYFPSRMMGVSVVRQSRVKGKVINPKPLFRKVETTPIGTTAPEKPTGVLQQKNDQMKKNLEKGKKK